MGEAFLRATKTCVSVRTPIRALFHARGRLPEELAGLAKNSPDFLLAKIDINKIMCYNPDKKFKEGACPFSCWVPNRTYLCDAQRRKHR